MLAFETGKLETGKDNQQMRASRNTHARASTPKQDGKTRYRPITSREALVQLGLRCQHY